MSADELIRILVAGGLLTLFAEAGRAVWQRRQMNANVAKAHVETVDVNVRIAGDLRDDAVSAWETARHELAAFRKEFDLYRVDTESRLTALDAELSAEKAEKEQVKRENEHLKRRVSELEAEVAQLKAAR